MGCETWRERMIERLYDEPGGTDDRTLGDHLEECADCERAMRDLRDARDTLAAGAPEVPLHRPLVVLGDVRREPSPARRVGTILAAAALLVTGLGLGRLVRDAGDTPPPADDPSIRALLAQHEERLTARFDEQVRRAIAEVATRSVSPEDLESTVDALRSAFEATRRSDLDRLEGEIAAVEIRSGAALDEAQRTLRYYALASNPDLTEW